MRSGIIRALAPALVIFQVSCSIFRSHPAPYPAGVVFPLAEVARATYKGQIVRSVRATGGRIYLATDKGFLYCLDEAKKSVIWEFAAASPFGCPPLPGPDQTLIWDRSNVLYCIDSDGRALWTREFKETITGEMAWHRGRVYLGTREGELMAFDPEKKEVLRIFQAGGALEAGPVFWDGTIIQACTDGRVYILGPEGKLRGTIDAGSPVRITPLVEGDRIYFGSDDSRFHCHGLRDLKRRWRIRIGGKVIATPKAVGNRVFFLASNNVLYALGRNGDILWWRITPARASYDLEFTPGQVIVTTQSSVLICLNLKTGEDLGKYDAGTEIRSNSLWLDPGLLVNVYDYADETGSLVFLEKEVKAALSASLPSPQLAGTEIAFTATAVGFYRPRFEFFLSRSGENRQIVQKESEVNSWSWFPEKEGSYRVGVRVVDEKQSRESEVSFEVVKKAPSIDNSG